MTRFARSKGSKSSNERIPETATPWSVMSQQLREKSSNNPNTRAEFEAQRKMNYEMFLKEEAIKQSKESWCEFEEQSFEIVTNPTTVSDKKTKKKKKRKEEQNSKILENDKSESEEMNQLKKDNKFKKICKKENEFKGSCQNLDDEDNFDIEDPELSKWCDEHSDKESDLKYKELTSQLKMLYKKNENDKQTKKSADFTITSDDVNKEIKLKKRKISDPSSDLPKKKQKKVEQQRKSYANVTNTTDTNAEIIGEKNKKKKRKNKANYSEQDCDSKSISKGSKSGETLVSNRESKQKKFKNQNHKNSEDGPMFSRRKPLPEQMHIVINGAKVEIVNMHGFPITAKDAERIDQLRKSLISKGIPRSEVERTIKLERRKSEKSLARLKKTLCFHCRKGGHILSECPEMNRDGKNTEMPVSGLCFKCGSTEHTHFNCKVVRTQDYKFAQCFICKEQGHISRQCPDNPKGIYPKGGACRVCGDVTHLRKDCPKVMQENDKNAIRLETLHSNNIEDIEVTSTPTSTTPSRQNINHVRF